MILLIDNYDSFVHNLARYFRRLGQSVHVERNDARSVSELAALRPQAIVLSPGPCTPNEAGVCLDLVRALRGVVPMLGVCLGHQTIAAACGGVVVRSPEPMHGRTSLILNDGTGLFTGLPAEFRVCRYHSLVVDGDRLPREFRVTARTTDGVVMAIEDRASLLWGVQFHPEAILTEHGYGMLANFLVLAIGAETRAPDFGTEMAAAPAALRLPDGPVTF